MYNFFMSFTRVYKEILMSEITQIMVSLPVNWELLEGRDQAWPRPPHHPVVSGKPAPGVGRPPRVRQGTKPWLSDRKAGFRAGFNLGPALSSHTSY